MNELSQSINQLDISSGIEKEILVRKIVVDAEAVGYHIAEINDQKPWGAYIRFDSGDADRFTEEFFPGLSPLEARLGNENAELSPKFLIVAPSQRLSWQYHNRRAERWVFLSGGSYEKSMTDDESEPLVADTGSIIQFAQGERHRLVGASDQYVIVAEIWQHSDAAQPSNEDDIIRLADDYKR